MTIELIWSFLRLTKTKPQTIANRALALLSTELWSEHSKWPFSLLDKAISKDRKYLKYHVENAQYVEDPCKMPFTQSRVFCHSGCWSSVLPSFPKIIGGIPLLRSFSKGVSNQHSSRKRSLPFVSWEKEIMCCIWGDAILFSWTDWLLRLSNADRYHQFHVYVPLMIILQ